MLSDMGSTVTEPDLAERVDYLLARLAEVKAERDALRARFLRLQANAEELVKDRDHWRQRYEDVDRQGGELLNRIAELGG